MMIHQVTYMVYVTPHSTHFPLMWLKPNHLHQISFSSYWEIYIGSLKVGTSIPINYPGLLTKCLWFGLRFFPYQPKFWWWFSFFWTHSLWVLVVGAPSHLSHSNCYNHVFKFLFANIWIGPKICGSLKNKVQVLENWWNVFVSIWFFFWEHFNIDVVNFLFFIFFANGVDFHNLNHFQPFEKWFDCYRFFWNTFSHPNNMTQFFLRNYTKARNAHEKN